MKCIKLNDGTIKRIASHIAEQLVNSNQAQFVAKKFWKENGRKHRDSSGCRVSVTVSNRKKEKKEGSR